jgi:hypothetical protein
MRMNAYFLVVAGSCATPPTIMNGLMVTTAS